MALPASGSISLSQVNAELGVASTTAISLNQTTARTLAGKASGVISLSDFYGKSNVSANTEILLHFDGSHGATTFVDSAGKFTPAAGGASTCYISTAQSKFGGSSLYTSSHGLGLSGGATSFSNYTGNYTIEFWVYDMSSANASVSRYMTYGPYDASIRSAGRIYHSYNFQWNSSYWAYNSTYTTTATTYNAWTHIAHVRNGSTVTLYKNGASIGTYTFTGPIDLTGLTIGCGNLSQQGVGEYFVGYIDEFRFSSTARYTANFTLPTAAFT